MAKNKIVFGEEAREKMFKGIESVYRAVSCTLGSRGRNVVFRLFKGALPYTTNDGVTISRQIMLDDEVEGIGADLIKTAAARTNVEVGDGTTTVTILAYHLVKEGLKMIKDHSPMILKREINKALVEALQLLKHKAIKIESKDDVRKIARISAEDDEIADIVTDAITKAGETGKVIVEYSDQSGIEKEEYEGMRIEQGYNTARFVNSFKYMEAVHEDIHVLVTDRKFTLNNEIYPFLEELAGNNIRKVVIFASDTTSEALATLLKNNEQAWKSNRAEGMESVVIKVPQDKEIIEDIAAYVGAKFISQEQNVKPSIAHLGKVRKIVVGKDSTLLIKGDRTVMEKDRFNTRATTLKEQLKKAKADEKEEVEKRLSGLTNATVIIRAGAPTDAEKRYRKDKIDDAVAATKAALAEGYVIGGGLTLRHICREVHKKLKSKGSELLSLAADKPVEILIQNSGVELKPESITETDGFETDSGKYVPDILEKGIIDPVLVERHALINAVSMASLFLTLEATIYDLDTKAMQSDV